MSLSDAPRCTATAKRSGQRCGNPAVSGYSVCFQHGAGRPRAGRPGGRPITHGRRSRWMPSGLADRYRESLSDPKLLELHTDVALAEARLGELLQRLSGTESSANWRMVQQATAELDVAIHDRDVVMMEAALVKLREASRQGISDTLQWAEIYVLLDQRRRLVEAERRHLIASQQMITSEQAMALAAFVVDTIHRRVPDREVVEGIRADLRAYLVDRGGEQAG